jgi:hypothetical protein
VGDLVDQQAYSVIVIGDLQFRSVHSEGSAAEPKTAAIGNSVGKVADEETDKLEMLRMDYGFMKTYTHFSPCASKAC